MKHSKSFSVTALAAIPFLWEESISEPWLCRSRGAAGTDGQSRQGCSGYRDESLPLPEPLSSRSSAGEQSLLPAGTSPACPPPTVPARRVTSGCPYRCGKRSEKSDVAFSCSQCADAVHLPSPEIDWIF